MKQLLLFVSLILTTPMMADIYWVQFADKKGTTGDVAHPEAFLSERAIQRRTAQGISIDETDLPVSQVYLDSLRQAGATILHCSKWMNGATVSATKTVVNAIKTYSFVNSVQCTRSSSTKGISPMRRKLQREKAESTDYGKAKTQIELYNLQTLHDAGYTGQGKMIAIVDDGFYKVNTNAAFDGVRSQILGVWDFTDESHGIYSTGSYGEGEHGAEVFSAIAGQLSNYAASAIGATYHLMRTEEGETESLKEPDNLIVAMETADSLGVDILTSSLGYYEFDDASTNYEYADMNGKTCRVSRAATIAARKGMIICIAAGNERQYDWYYIDAPADADSILAVGSVTSSKSISSFSSAGPSADGRIKPEVCAMGTSTALVSPSGSVTNSSGTSFACPLMAGFVACLWSALPTKTNMEIIHLVEQSGNHYSSPDNDYGYGIPNAWTAYQLGLSTDLQNIGVSQENGPMDIYDLQGRKLGSIPQSGFYIVREGERVQKYLR